MPITVGAAPAADVAAGELAVLRGMYPITVPLTTGPAGLDLFQGTGHWCGWALIDPSGTVAAVVEIYDGMDVGGQLMCVAGVSAGASAAPIFEPEGVSFHIGLFLNVVSGTVRGVIWARLRAAS